MTNDQQENFLDMGQNRERRMRKKASPDSGLAPLYEPRRCSATRNQHITVILKLHAPSSAQGLSLLRWGARNIVQNAEYSDA